MPVTLSPTDLTKSLRMQLPGAVPNHAAGNEVARQLNVIGKNVGHATLSVGAESGGNAIVVSVQLYDAQGNELTRACAVDVLLLADAAGAAFNTNNYTIAAGTDGAVVEVVADKVLKCISEADGDLDISLTIAGGATCYVAVVLPGGKLAVSSAVTHAA